MADQRSNSGDDIQRHAAGASSTTSPGTSSSSRTDSASDRERSIATGREGSRSPSVSRRPGERPYYGFGPFSLFRRMTEDMDRMFDLALGRSGSETWMPQVEAFRRGDKLVVRADLPGLKKEDVNVEVNEGMLTISGERCDEREENRDDVFRSERTYGQFYRAVPLPDGVNPDQCEATFKDGVLEVTIPAPKQTEKKTRVTVK